MRIAFFADAYRPRVSGQVASLDEFCRSLTERGHEVCIVCPEYPPERMKGQSEPFKTIRVPSGWAIVSADDRLGLPWKGQRAMRELDEFDPEAVHIQTEFSIGAMGRRYCRKRCLPIMSTCHTFYEMYVKWYLPFLPDFVARPVVKTWMRSVYAHDELIVIPSRRIRDIMLSYGIDKEYAVIPTGVDERIFYSQTEKGKAYRQKLDELWPGVAEGSLLVYVGRISLEKNLEMLADAIRRVFAEDPNAYLAMVGDGPRKAEIQQMFLCKGLKDRVIWTGFVPREELPIVYSAADLFVFPSVTETQGLVTIEAMLCGTPVVGVNKMGTAEIMEGDTGGLLAEDDARDFARQILRLLGDPSLRAEKASQALKHGQNWTIGHLCDEMEKLYLRIFGS